MLSSPFFYFAIALSMAYSVFGKAHVHPSVRRLVGSRAPHAMSVILHLTHQADFNNDQYFVSKNVADRDSVGQYVYSTLTSVARESQASLIADLKTMNGVIGYRTYRIANVVAVDFNDESVLVELAGRDDVDFIEPNAPFQVPLEMPGMFSSRLIQQDHNGDHTTGDDTEIKLDDSPEWNLEWINVPSAWNSSNLGQGTIYANADTGVLWEHEALIGNYLGVKEDGSVDHNYAWWDAIKKPLQPGKGPCGFNSKEPCDDNGHGTHTTSTSVGSKGVGVAPKAKWMACRNMDRGFGSSESYLGCLEFFMAPRDLDGNNPDPKLRPHAIGNSYGCPSSEGCARNAFTRAVENLRKAGVFMSVSAGNEGPRCSTIESPPGYEPAVISVGATSKMSPRITSFSSRGPSFHLGADKPLRKPDVTAPGSMVRAAFISKPLFPGLPPSRPNNRYATLSGTSMASPHVGGAALILTQACPCLERNVDAIQDILQTTAHHYTVGGSETKVPSCGSDGPTTSPNNVYGYGGIDLLPALVKCRDFCGLK